MAAADDLTFDLVPPRRPTLDDLGGADFEDDDVNPPDPTSMPNAGEANVKAKTMAAVARVMPLAQVWVRIVSGTPVIYNAIFASTLLNDSSITLTDEAAGRVRLSWSPDAFPALAGEPAVTPTYTTDANNPALQSVAAQSELIVNGCKVRTYLTNTAGLVDYNFVVVID